MTLESFYEILKDSSPLHSFITCLQYGEICHYKHYVQQSYLTQWMVWGKFGSLQLQKLSKTLHIKNAINQSSLQNIGTESSYLYEQSVK
jgi:hypothetical protein